MTSISWTLYSNNVRQLTPLDSDKGGKHMTLPIAIVASTTIVCITVFITIVTVKGMDLKTRK
ncbi:hypothetical protein J2TS4_53120 [Paenibacillus sp. J2TS4]|nr:hypothetical protein J2TS4_53120 [Paenibacillus sp. J2TS4]